MSWVVTFARAVGRGGGKVLGDIEKELGSTLAARLEEWSGIG